MPNIGFWAVAGASAPVVAGAFDHLATTLISTNTATVTFDTSTYAALGYKHLQLRMTLRGSNSAEWSEYRLRFNSDTGSNYTRHALYGDGSAAGSFGYANTSFLDSHTLTGASAGSGIFGATVMDILDPFASTKNKTLRVFGGRQPATDKPIFLLSGAWLNTSPITSMEFTNTVGSFVSGSRFSIYGLKG